MAAAPTPDFDVPPEVACPLCLDLLDDPVSTPCSHTFCRSCVGRARGAGHRSCPLCRRDLSRFDPLAASVDAATVSLIASAVPQEVVAHRRRRAMQRLQVVVGNLHEEELGCGGRSGRNANKWTMYVALQGTANQHAASLIEKVVYELHPTFQPDVVTAYGPHFSLCRYGWGTFAVGCVIHWQRQLQMPPTRIDHHLVFEDQGGRTTEAVEFTPEGWASFSGILDRVGSSGGQRGMARVGSNGTLRAGRALLRPPGEVARSRSQGGASELVELVVGNRCEVMTSDDGNGNRYRWTMYVKLPGFQRSAARMIDRVVYELHPTFQPNAHTRRSPRFELTCTGWGTFPVNCTVHWHRDLRLQPKHVVHDLVLEPDGSRTAVTVGIHPRYLESFR